MSCDLMFQVEPKEDYSHLPPEQQRRKLQHKVDQLEALGNKAFSDKYVKSHDHHVIRQACPIM